MSDEDEPRARPHLLFDAAAQRNRGRERRAVQQRGAEGGRTQPPKLRENPRAPTRRGALARMAEQGEREEASPASTVGHPKMSSLRASGMARVGRQPSERLPMGWTPTQGEPRCIARTVARWGGDRDRDAEEKEHRACRWNPPGARSTAAALACVKGASSMSEHSTCASDS